MNLLQILGFLFTFLIIGGFSVFLFELIFIRKNDKNKPVLPERPTKAEFDRYIKRRDNYNQNNY